MNYTTEESIDSIRQKINYGKVDEIMNGFDFNIVHDYMVKTDWKWIDKVPTLEEIKAQAQNLLFRAVDEYVKTKQPFGNIGTGGFMVYYFPWGMELVFKLEYRSTF